MAITNNELLRKLVPGVKAEYEVKKFTFPNLVAFVVAKMVNENNQINCMLLDYEKIFEEYAIGSIYDYYEEEEYKYLKNKIISTINGVLANSIVKDSFRLYCLGTIDWNKQLQYYSQVLQNIINIYLTKEGVDFIADNYLDIADILGIRFCLARPNVESDEVIELKKIWMAEMPIILSEVLKHLIELNERYLIEANSVQIQGTPMPAFQPLDNVATEMPRVNLVGWNDIQPGVISTEEQSEQTPVQHPLTGDPKYDSLSEQEKGYVDAIVKGISHANEMKQNPHKYAEEIKAAQAALKNATMQPVNIDVTKIPNTGCNCGNPNCNCGNH